MKFRYITTSIVLTSLMMLSISCNNSKKAVEKEENPVSKEPSTPITHIPDYAVDFYAAAEDRSWKLSVKFDEEVVFTDIKNNISFSSNETKMQVAQGANVINVWGENAIYEVHVIIDVVECDKNKKIVNVMVRRRHDKKEFEYSGCGIYRGKPQIHDIWVLYELNGEKISPEKFPREFPHFEFDLAQQKMSGFAGCNHVNGNISFDYRTIKIEPLISTKMYCSETSNIENEILKILRNNPVYHIKDLHLYLETTEGSITLRKVD